MGSGTHCRTTLVIIDLWKISHVGLVNTLTGDGIAIILECSINEALTKGGDNDTNIQYLR